MILFRYLTREILSTMLAVTFTLLIIVISGRLVAYLGSAAAGNLPASLVFTVILYRLPGFLELIMPLAFFISVLLALGRLYVDSEMVVISACGIGPGRLLAIIMVPAFITAAVVATMSLVVSPYTTLRVQTMLHDARNTTGLELLSPGRFRIINQGQGRVTYVDRMDQDSGEMAGVFAADRLAGNDGISRQVLIVAEHGRLDVDPESGERFLVLGQGTRYVGQPGDLAYQVMDFDKLGQRVEQPPSAPMYRKQDMLTTSELLRSRRIESVATLQWRVSLALLVLVSTLMAMALARTDHRRGRYGKLFPAFLLFMVYLVLLNAAREAVNKHQLPPDLGLWWIHGVFLLVGLGMLWGGDYWRARRARRRLAQAAGGAA